MSAQEDDTFTIATLNLRSIRDSWLRRAPLVAGGMRELAPDAAALQEVSTWSLQGAWLRWRMNRGRAPGAPYRHWHATNREIGSIIEGESLISRLPIVDRDVLRFGIDGRIAQRATLVLPSGRSFDLVNTHLANGYKAAERLSQAEMLLEWLDRRQLPVVMAGDLNARPESPVIALLKERFVSAHEAAHGREPERTQPPWPVPPGEWSATYDYIMVSREITVDACRVVFDQPSPPGSRTYPSDHLGLFAALRLGSNRAET